MWLKYKDKYNKHDDWHYRFLCFSTRKNAKIIANEIIEEMYNTTHYHCVIDYDIVDTIPAELLKVQIIKFKKEIKYYTSCIKKINRLLTENTIEEFDQIEGPHSWKPENASTK